MVSIIIPVYNAELYLGECIDSIVEQSYQDWELILVDDGSIDNSGRICDEYAKRDTRIKVLHKKNGGVTAARRDGVLQSVGEWIFFVDADDKVEKDGLKGLIEYSIACPDVDIVEGTYIWFYPDGTTKQRPCRAKGVGLLKLNGLDYAISLCSADGGNRGPWAKVIRKSVLMTSGGLYIPRTITNREDILMLTFVAKKINYAALLDYPVYKYRSQFGITAVSNILSWSYWSNYLQYLDEVALNEVIHEWERGREVNVLDVFKEMVHGRNKRYLVPEYFKHRVVPTLWKCRKELPVSDRLVLLGLRIPYNLGIPLSWCILTVLKLKNNLFRGYYAKRSRKSNN